jgi:prepilin-type processing-associated H-X9-DG protein
MNSQLSVLFGSNPSNLLNSSAKVSRIQSPSSRILVTDSQNESSGFGCYITEMSLSNTDLYIYPQFRHNKTVPFGYCNMLFVDGHVNKYKLSEVIGDKEKLLGRTL